MSINNTKKVFIMNRDQMYLDMLKQDISVLETVDVETFLSEEECVKKIGHGPDIVLIDYYPDPAGDGNGKGSKTITRLLGIRPDLKIIVISDRIDRELTMQCLISENVSFISRAMCDKGYITEKVFDLLYGSVPSNFEQKTM